MLFKTLYNPYKDFTNKKYKIQKKDPCKLESEFTGGFFWPDIKSANHNIFTSIKNKAKISCSYQQNKFLNHIGKIIKLLK